MKEEQRVFESDSVSLSSLNLQPKADVEGLLDWELQREQTDETMLPIKDVINDLIDRIKTL